MDKVVIVTGGAAGIGFEIAKSFAKKNYKVISFDIIDNSFDGITFYKVDVSNEIKVKEKFNSIISEFGGVHILINNAAISNFNKPVTELTVDEFKNVINVNLTGTLICSLEFIKANKGSGFGRIINISSTRYNQNEIGWDAYGASKGGITSLTSSMAISLSNTGVTVNCISPGWIQVNAYDELEQIHHKQHPSGRVGKPKDIANVCLFLADEENDFINGVNIIVDGGMSKKMIYYD